MEAGSGDDGKGEWGGQGNGNGPLITPILCRRERAPHAAAGYCPPVRSAVLSLEPLSPSTGRTGRSRQHLARARQDVGAALVAGCSTG